MIELLTGVPGSGKTYFAVDRLYHALEKKDRPIFTNINLRIPYDDILQPLDTKDFHDFCSAELAFHEEYRKENPEGGNYDQALKDSGILDKYGSALLLWDECHNDLDELDPAFVRWMSYHRHFEGMDVLLITQSIDLIFRKYRKFVDKYYFGQNAAKRLFSSTFIYKVYIDHRAFEKHLVETISLKSDPKIFAFYDSGDYKVNKSALVKKLAPIVGIIVFLAVFIKYVLFGMVLNKHHNEDNLSDIPNAANSEILQLTPEQVSSQNALKALNEEQQRQADQAIIDQQQTPLLPPPPLPNGSQNTSFQSSPGTQSQMSRYLVRLQCTQTYCYFPANRFTISLPTMQRFLSEFGGKILSAEMVTGDLSVITAVVPSELYFMIESHNIESRSDNYGPQSQKNNYSSNTAAVPTFAPNPGF